jgi:type II secretory pathway component GspD/PulD (secretin)
MKSRSLILLLVGLVASTLGALAQTNAPAATEATPSPQAQPEAKVSPAAAPAEAAAPAAAPAAPAEAAAPLTPGTVIPLVVMDDVPLTDAIRNLARQAALNYMLDPKIGFVQPGPDGKIAAQPSVSIRWENVTAEQALNALLGNYNLQLVEDPKTKIARITIRDPAAPDPLVTKIIQLKYASPSNILASIQSALTDKDKRSKVVPDTRTSQLVVLATEREMAAIDEMIARLDLPTKQVLIEARLLEAQMNPKTVKGVDWTHTFKNQRVTFGNGTTTGLDTRSTASASQGDAASALNSSFNRSSSSLSSSGSAPPSLLNSSSSSASAIGAGTISGASGSASSASQVLNTLLGGSGIGLNTMSGFNPATAFLNADGVSATISFLNEYAETKVISSPRTVTLDNEPSFIEAGTMWPIVNVTAGTANTTGGSTISYSNLTVRLTVTPRISANDFVHLKVNPRVVRLGDPVVSKVGGLDNVVDSFNTRDIETSVMIPSGNTLVMGGLIQDEIHNGNIKVPILGDLPGIGLLFRQDSKNRTKANLIVFITPTIVQDNDFQPTKSAFMKTPVPSKDYIENDWSAWDSGKPKDWSKKSKENQPMIPDSSFGPTQ